MYADNALIWGFDVLLVGGIGMLALSLRPACDLVRLAPTKSLRRRWQMLAAAISAFIVAYIEHLARHHGDHRDFGVPIVYFLGALFVLVVTTLMRRTASDLLQLMELRRLNHTDSLLPIHNRRYFARRLLREIERNRRFSSGSALLMIDIDHLKRINDGNGHHAGDEVLRAVAARINDAVRESDVVARWGGDEIAVIAPGAGRAVAQAVAERLRAAVARETVTVVANDGTVGRVRVTVSVGVALAGSEDDSESLLRQADAALYEAKRAGRDRVVVAAPATDTCVSGKPVVGERPLLDSASPESAI